MLKCAQDLDYPESVGEWVGKGSKNKGKQAIFYTYSKNDLPNT